MRRETPLRAIAPLVLALAMAAPVEAQPPETVVETGPGWGVATTTTLASARVAAIDPASRRVELLLADGRILALVAGAEVRRLSEIRVGDVVDVAFVESLALELRKDGKALVTRSEGTDTRRAPSSAAPAGVRQSDVTVLADVVAVNAATGVVTLRGPQATIDLRINDPAQLALVKPGDKVQATYSEAVAVSIDRVR